MSGKEGAPTGRTPALAQRCHDSVMSSRTLSSAPDPLRNASHAARISDARAVGSVVRSIASQGFRTANRFSVKQA
jgi:hypothetical protein